MQVILDSRIFLNQIKIPSLATFPCQHIQMLVIRRYNLIVMKDWFKINVAKEKYDSFNKPKMAYSRDAKRQERPERDRDMADGPM